MTLTFSHFGLYFNADQMAHSRAQREDKGDINTAWKWLTGVPDTDPAADDEPPAPGPPAPTGAAAILVDALRYRCAEDHADGETAAQALMALTAPETIEAALIQAHITELVRDHPAFAAHADDWLARYRHAVSALLASADDSLPESARRVALRVVAGVVLEDETLLQQGADAFRHIVEEQIHPEGYLRPLTEYGGGDGTFAASFETVRALSLAAEAATQAGVDLWAYDVRDVSLNTAVTYLVFYYFFSEKWRWKETLDAETVKRLFRERGAFVEMAAYRASPRYADNLLDETRPLFDASGGGLTTLTHAARPEPPRQRRRWFGLG